tara:strand:+ start:312 stop:743 length:432 start_codon:yes stop_codon:yes gene_type:complete
MLISCTSCNSKYLVNSADLKPDGRLVQCVNCKNQWYQEIELEESLEILNSPQSAATIKEKKEENDLSNKTINLPSTYVKEQKVSVINSVLALLFLILLFLCFFYFKYLEINTLVLLKYYFQEFVFNIKLIIKDIAIIIHAIVN